MFQETRRRLAIWYTCVTAILLLLFATGFYLYVRSTLIERIDDTLSHVVEVVQRSLVIQYIRDDSAKLQVDLKASFPDNAAAVEDDHIDLEWFSPTGVLLWSTFSMPLDIPLHPNNTGETVSGSTLPESLDSDLADPEAVYAPLLLRQVTQQVKVSGQVVGYLRVSHPWFEVSKPTRQLIRDLSLGILLVLGAVAAIGWLLSGLAITPMRDAYQRLKQFTADASHELRNPIAVIQTNVQVALADPDPSLQQDQLLVVERLTRRLGRLVDDLLFLARSDSGLSGLRTSSIELDRLLSDVIEEQQALALDRGIELQWMSLPKPEQSASDCRPDYKSDYKSDYKTIADSDQLTRLFTNLISNAVQYTAVNGTVKVSLRRLKGQTGHSFQIQIQDTGVGIPAESIPHLFDRFYRVDPARTMTAASGNAIGSGLGLAIAKAIVDNHHGQIQINSSLNQGTTVTVTLPCPKNAAVLHSSESNASNLYEK